MRKSKVDDGVVDRRGWQQTAMMTEGNFGEEELEDEGGEGDEE